MSYQSKFESEDTELLFDAILALESKEDCYRFFEDIATIHELKELAQRIHIAKLLREELTYQKIEEQTNASTATISRVSRCLYYGAEGYSRILDKLGS
jgi:TrpR-related protein YerC/YecD